MSKAKIIEYKTFEFDIAETKESEDTTVGVFEGYASTFNNIDYGLDKVAPGAFKKTIKEFFKWPILKDHNPYEPLGINLEASEDSKGLAIKGELELGVQAAKERWLLMKQAKRNKGRAGLSIGYLTIKGEPDGENPRVRILKEIKMFEYSSVTFPMNPKAMVTAAKSIGEVDKAKFLIQQLVEQGISLKDLEIALRNEAAQVDEDPTKISQSIDNLILKFRNG